MTPIKKTSPSSLGKPLPSHKNLESTLRHQIVIGELAPGSRLPNRLEIERQFGVSMPTVQKALDALIRDGFVHARPGSGTFVVDDPPHLRQYALVFPDPSFRSRFYATLRLSAGLAAEERAIRVSEYFHHDPEDHQRLSEDVAAYRLAGLIFVHPQWDLWDSLAVRTPGIPRSIIAGLPKHGIPAVDVDMPRFFPMALQHLAARGRRKIAAVFPYSGHRAAESFTAAARELGLEIRPYWLCTVAQDMQPAAVESTIRLLLELANDKRPDSLVVLDDNLLEPVLCAAMASPVRVPEQLEILTHCNYPLAPGGKLPLIRLGFDCNRIIELALKNLDDQRDGRTPAPLTLVEPTFEPDLSA